jgi:hypothetical protein
LLLRKDFVITSSWSRDDPHDRKANRDSQHNPSIGSPESSSASLLPGQVTATLKAGETAKAVGVYHGQDYDGFKVKLADGTEGLIIAADTFKVVSK